MNLNTSPISVVVVDDHEMVRDAIVARLEKHPRIDVVGWASDSDSAVQVAREKSPRVVLMDVNLPGRGAFDASVDIMTDRPDTRVLLLSGFLADVFISQALKLRLSGYLLKGEPMEFLCEAIERIANGETVMSKDVEERIAFDPVQRRHVARFESDLSSLTGRQLEVLRHLACGQSVKEIAKVMHLSQKSVDSHKYRIMNKLGIHDRVELARFAIREGLMVP